MRIALVAPFPRSRHAHGEESLGGVASYTKSLVAGWGPDARVKVLAPCDAPTGVRVEGGVEVHELPRTGRALARAIAALGDDDALDAVHVQFEQHLFGGLRQNARLVRALRRLRTRTRVFLTLHQVPDLDEVDHAFLRRNGFPPFPRLARAWMRLQYARLAAASHRVIVHEAALAERLARQYGIDASRVVVIPHGVERFALPMSRAQAKRALKVDEDHALILYFGYVTGYKGVDLLAEALARIPADRRATTRVIVAGKVPERKLENAAFREETAALEGALASLAPWVERKGFLSADDISLHLAAADVVVFPYSHVFGASGPHALAVGHGRPCLLSDAFRGMDVPERALFARTPEALAAKLVAWLDDPALRVALETDAHERAARCAWPQVAALHANAYTSPSAARVLLMGAYGQDNLGDEALLEVHLQQLAGREVTVASSDPVQTSRRYGVPAVPTYGGLRSLRAFLRARAVVLGGGSVLKELAPPHPRHRVVASLALLTTLARVTGRVSILSAVGVERLHTRRARWLARRAARAATLVHVRDEGSRRTLAALDAAERARVVADPAFLLETDAPARARAEGLLADAHGRPVVVLNPMSSHEAGRSHHDVAAAFAALADDVVAKLDAHVLLLPFKTKGEDNDVDVTQRIRALVSHPARMSVAPFDLRPAEALAVLERSAFVVGMRHHGVLLALVADAPVLAIPYAPKTEHLVEEFGLRVSLHAKALESDALRAAFWLAYEGRETQRAASRVVLATMRARAEDNFARIRRALAEAG